MTSEHFALALAGKTPEQIRAHVEKHLKSRIETQYGLYTTSGKPKEAGLREQAAYIAGALAALSAVFNEEGQNTFGPPINGIATAWTMLIFSGRYVFPADSKFPAKK